MINKKIYLSPSMQAPNLYASGNTNEMEQCNRISAYAEAALKRCGFQVKSALKGQDMYASIRESNSWGADLHIPIHTNAYNGKVTGGTLVMLYDNASENIKAGEAVLRSVSKISPGSDYSLRYNPSLAELNSTAAVAVYLEVEFHDTKEGAQWIIANVKNIGEAIAKGVCDYYSVPYVNENIPKENYETALLEALLRQAYAVEICKTYNDKVDNKKDALSDTALKECKVTLGYKNSDATLDLEFIKALDSEITARFKSREAENLKLRGDFNSDGKIDVKDATAIQKFIAGMDNEDV